MAELELTGAWAADDTPEPLTGTWALLRPVKDDEHVEPPRPIGRPGAPP